MAALRHRDITGHGQYIDIAMLDATMAMTDIVTNFYSLASFAQVLSTVPKQNLIGKL